MTSLLEEAETLERRAAEERVSYLSKLVPRIGGLVLDVGCGNGYAVRRWLAGGHRAVGVDRSLYRLARWAEEPEAEGWLVVGDAGSLPFRSGAFDLVVSSGMIEHVGVSESSSPYRVFPHADRDAQREAVVAELGRVVHAGGTLVMDCPNGAFPIDFWHGDRIGAFRLHPVPDRLLPTHYDLLRWASRAGLHPRIEPLSGRLRFRQIGRRWWGRLLAPLVSFFLRRLDRWMDTRYAAAVAGLYPYVVVSCRRV
jgi:SAM-dependent methyltransferase